MEIVSLKGSVYSGFKKVPKDGNSLIRRRGGKIIGASL